MYAFSPCPCSSVVFCTFIDVGILSGRCLLTFQFRHCTELNIARVERDLMVFFITIGTSKLLRALPPSKKVPAFTVSNAVEIN